MTSRSPGLPSGDPLQPLTEQLGVVVRQEVERVWRETTRPYRESRTAVRLLGGSAVVGSMAAGSATGPSHLGHRRLRPWRTDGQGGEAHRDVRAATDSQVTAAGGHCGPCARA